MQSIINSEIKYSSDGKRDYTPQANEGYSYSPNTIENSSTKQPTSYEPTNAKSIGSVSGSLNNTQYAPSPSTFKSPQRYESPRKDELSEMRKELSDQTLQREEMISSIKRLRIENEYLAQEMRDMNRVNSELKQHSSETHNASLPSELETIKKQRDFFESELRRVNHDHFKNPEHKGQINIENDRTTSELRKEINGLKLQYQGESKRLNEIIATLKLENNGLRNLRGVLEAEIEKLKDALREHEQFKEQLTKFQIENLNLKNQSEALVVNIRAKNEEFQRLEVQLKSILNEKNSMAQNLKDKLTETEISFSMRAMLTNIEIERLHSIMDQLLDRVFSLEQKSSEEVRRMEDELKSLRESQVAERKMALDQIKELQKALGEHDCTKQKLNDDIERMELQISELEKDVLHWKERYRIIESSHKYLIDAVEKFRTNSHEINKDSLPEVTKFLYLPY